MRSSLDISAIEYIILDLGGVLFKIRSVEQWMGEYIIPLLGSDLDIDTFRELYYANEAGRLTPVQLKANLEQLSGKEFSMAEFEHAWNGILLDMPERNMDTVRRLAEKYTLYLLSNANSIHVASWWKTVHDKFGKNAFPDAFEGFFYSHELGFIKPAPEIYQLVHEGIGSPPRSSCLFFDDKPENVKAAVDFGWHSIVVDKDLDKIAGSLGLI